MFIANLSFPPGLSNTSDGGLIADQYISLLPCMKKLLGPLRCSTRIRSMMYRQQLITYLSALLPLSFAVGPPPRDDVPPPAPPTGCLALSLTSPAWEVEYFQYYKTERLGIEFTLKNVMDMSFFRCSGSSAETVETLSINCAADSSGTENTLVARVVFSNISNRLWVKQEWVCNDNSKTQR